MDILNLVDTCGDIITPGMTAKVWAVCACDIDVFPGFLATTNPGDSITLDGDIVLKANKYFAQIDVVTESGEVKHTQVGSSGSENYVNTYDFKTRKTVAADEWFNKHRGACFVFIVEEKTGAKRVLGTPSVPAKMVSSEGTTGMNNEGEKIWTAQIKDTVGEVAPVYTGAIDIDPLT